MRQSLLRGSFFLYRSACYDFDMNLVIPKTLQIQVQRRAKKHGITEVEYIRTAIKQTIEAEDDLATEMELWERASLYDFNEFVKKHKL